MNFGKIFKAFYNAFNPTTSNISIEVFFDNRNRVSDLTRKQMLNICKTLRKNEVPVRNDYMRLPNAILIQVTYNAMKYFEHNKD